ncbi:ATP--guanido phosphotransferase [Gemmatimonadota bacterium]
MPESDPLQALQRLGTESPGWLGDGRGVEEEGIVLSTRVRLARNLSGIPFPHQANEMQRIELLERTWEAISDLNGLRDGQQFRVDELEPMDRRLLLERSLISPVLAETQGPRGVAFSLTEATALMVNEEDHLRLQTNEAGLAPQEAWDRIDGLDSHLGERLPYAYSPVYGHLTASPTDVGTGLRIGILVHLPALMLIGEAEAVLRGAAQVGMLVSGVHGEGSSVHGNMYQVSNQMTLGRSEEDILASVKRVTDQVVDQERVARDTLRREALAQIEDKVYRALGVLQNARLLNTRECLNLLSAVRLGVNMFVLSGVRISTLHELTILTQPAHLDRREGRELDSSERDALRARLVRERLAAG